jgi:LPS-assembly protein
MTRAVVNKVKVLMRDESRIWADTFVKKPNDNKQMRNASYTACDMCQGKSPLWRIDARKVNYDAKGQNINYNDAVLRIKDVPVFYLPFLSHPSPEVKRRSGLLMTSMGSSNYMGEYIQPTYFWNVSDQTDVILSPYFTTDQDVVFGGKYRQYFYNGHVNAEGTYVKDKDNDNENLKYRQFKRPKNRGSLFMDARYEINDYWVANLDVNYASDVFYLKDMDLPKRDDAWLTSKLSFERFEGRDYASIEGYYYKLTSYNLKASNNAEYQSRMKSLPEVAPFIEYENITNPFSNGSYFKTNISEASVYRDNDEESQRLTMINSWELPYTSDYGEQYRFVASVKSDIYHIDDYAYQPNDTYDGNLARVFPQLGVEWRLPFVRATETSRQILEPVVVAVLAPENDNNVEKIPNADSADTEFDDANILSLDRYAGYDRNDDGSRVSYGLNWSSYGNILGRTSAFIAQSYQISEDSSFMRAIEEEDKFSDYVGRVYAKPGRYLDLNYRFSLDKDTYDLTYSELGARVGADILNVYTSYIYLQPNQNSYYASEERKELYFSVNSKLTKDWSASIYDRIDLTDGGGTLENGGSLTYEDECLRLSFVAKKYNYDDPTLDDGYEFGVTFFFKTLGGFGSD